MKSFLEYLDEVGGAGEVATKKLVDRYVKDTPYENLEIDKVRERHKREKEQNAVQRDKELDAARLKDVKAKNKKS